MRITLRHLAPVIAAGGIAAALAAAPLAGAQPTPTEPQCTDVGGAQAIGESTTECQSPGNVSIVATPAQQEYLGPWGNMWDTDGYFFP